MSVQICEAFHLIGKLGSALGVKSIKDFTGCWEHDIDEHWHIALNGHQETVKSSSGVEVAPFNCWVEWNGWPAGYLDPRGGIIAAGEAANEESFCDALRAAIAKAEAAK